MKIVRNLKDYIKKDKSLFILYKLCLDENLFLLRISGTLSFKIYSIRQELKKLCNLIF